MQDNGNAATSAPHTTYLERETARARAKLAEFEASKPGDVFETDDSVWYRYGYLLSVLSGLLDAVEDAAR